jgi:23S rRNA (cytidine2498-2'-O)-methyltransferase
MTIQCAYLAPVGFLDALVQELSGVVAVHDRLVLTDLPVQPAFWAQNIWLQPQTLAIRSISDAAAQLKSLQRNWQLYSHTLHRRAQLIQEKLPHVSSNPILFPMELPPAPLGSWTLLDANTVLASAQCSSLFPGGEPVFKEDREGPPSRAYLKLWEAWTLMGVHPLPGQFCIDAGGSPGGWAWAVQQLGARVLSVDRSPLAPKITSLPGVEFRRGDFFTLNPLDIQQEFSHIDWLLSDVICYPEKLYAHILKWLDAGVCDNFICTLKFQGGTDYSAAKKFSEIPGSRVLHLHNNKHELTWMLRKNS